MRRLQRSLLFFAGCAVLSVLDAARADAALYLQITDTTNSSTTTVTSTDVSPPATSEGFSFTNLPGEIDFNSTALPAMSKVTAAAMDNSSPPTSVGTDLTGTAKSGVSISSLGPATVTIVMTETGFISSGSPLSLSYLFTGGFNPGTSGDSVTAQSWLDTGNNFLAAGETGTTTNAQSAAYPLSLNASGSITGISVTPFAPFSLTTVLTVAFGTSGGDFNSSDLSVTVSAGSNQVGFSPEPSTMLLWGLGLTFAGGAARLRRRRIETA